MLGLALDSSLDTQGSEECMRRCARGCLTAGASLGAQELADQPTYCLPFIVEETGPRKRGSWRLTDQDLVGITEISWSNTPILQREKLRSKGIYLLKTG